MYEYTLRTTIHNSCMIECWAFFLVNCFFFQNCWNLIFRMLAWEKLTISSCEWSTQIRETSHIRLLRKFRLFLLIYPYSQHSLINYQFCNSKRNLPPQEISRNVVTLSSYIGVLRYYYYFYLIVFFYLQKVFYC